MNLCNYTLQELANLDFICACGQRHKTDIKNIIIESGAVFQLPNLVHTELNHPKQSILLVFDLNTKRVAGERVAALLKKEGFRVRECYFDDPELIASEENIETIKAKVGDDTGLLIAVGSGTLNDITKYVSFLTKIPYFVVATAPSMDGYSSTVAPLVFNGFKYAYEAVGPLAIIGDIDILKEAPMEMMAAGLGDLIGKYTSICDWKISKLLNKEYYCEDVAKLIIRSVEICLVNLDGLYKREPGAVAKAMEALVLAGIAMSYVGNSRPASSSEHHIAHFWELMLLLNNKKAVLHGTKVGIATAIVCDIYKKLMTYTPDFEKGKAYIEAWDKAAWEEKMKELYKSGAEDVIRLENEYKKNEPTAALERLQKTIECWEQIKELAKNLPESSKVIEALRKLNGETKPLQLGLSKEDIYNAILYSKEMRFRYAILQMLWDFGVIEAYAKECAEVYS